MTAIILALVALIVLMIGGLVWLMMDQGHRVDAYASHCREANGHIYKPDSISFCLTADGRFIEVYP